EVGSLLVPADARGFAIGMRDGRKRWRIDRSACARKATDRAGAAMLAMLAPALIARLCRSSAVVTDFSRGQRIGGRDRRRPARTNGRKNLHHQRDQDDGKIFLQATAHLAGLLGATSSANHRQVRKSRSRPPQNME